MNTLFVKPSEMICCILFSFTLILYLIGSFYVYVDSVLNFASVQIQGSLYTGSFLILPEVGKSSFPDLQKC